MLHETSLIQRISPWLQEVSHSETLLINELSDKLARENKTVYRFGFGQSPFPVMPSVVEALRLHAHRKEYAGVQGMLALREAVTRFHNEMCQFNWESNRVVVGAGSKILLYCLMGALRHAEVALVTPCWVSYEPQAKQLGHKVSKLETSYSNDWLLTAEELDAFCIAREDASRPLMLLLNYPNNPTGKSYSYNQLKALADVCRKHQIIVIADEIYGLLDFSGDYKSISHYYPEGTVVTTGLSKWAGAGGWRLGVCHIPAALGDGFLAAVNGLMSETVSCVASPIQMAAIEAYQVNASVKEFIREQRNILARLASVSCKKLVDAGLNVHRGDGGFYLYVDFSPIRESLFHQGVKTGSQLTTKIMAESGVALLPAEAFGMTEETLAVRLCFVDFDGAAALNDPDFEFIQVERGIDALVQWTKCIVSEGLGYDCQASTNQALSIAS